MSLSLTPFFSNNYWPAIPTWNSFDRELDRDLAQMQRFINDTTRHFVPDQHGVIHRQPNYSYEETDQQAYVEVELPGVPKENVNIDLEGSSLIITAKRFKPGTTVDVQVTSADEHHEGNADENEKDTTIEDSETAKDKTPSVIYDLKLRVGQKYNTKDIQATMEGDGLLKINIPLKTKDAPRPIQIQSANM